MPREKINDLTTPGRYTEVSWRRDKQESGYVQVSTHDPSMVGVYVHLDGAGIDRLIKALHKAKRQAFGDSNRIIGDTPDLPVGPVRFIGDVTGPGDFWVPTGPNGEGHWV